MKKIRAIILLLTCAVLIFALFVGFHCTEGQTDDGNVAVLEHRG